MIVRDLQAVVGREAPRADASSARAACPTRYAPASEAARTRSGSSIPFLEGRRRSRCWGAEAGGDEHGDAATLSHGRVSVLHGSRSYVLADMRFLRDNFDAAQSTWKSMPFW